MNMAPFGHVFLLIFFVCLQACVTSISFSGLTKKFTRLLGRHSPLSLPPLASLLTAVTLIMRSQTYVHVHH